MSSEVLVSGIRPTGALHLGNYYGAFNGLRDYQNMYDAYFFIADIHALTTHPDPDRLAENVREAAEHYLAAGLDPAQCTFYLQSSIAAELCELMTYLGMVMPLGDLLRCPTFKEKAKKHSDHVHYGLVGYPVLMAADILVHKGRYVPVGEDQLVHLEMARTIARRFNRRYGDVLTEPVPLKRNAVRVPSLSGKGKMSKSDAGDSYIAMDDDPDTVFRKVEKAFSDPSRIRKSIPGTPTREGCNVYHLHTFFSDGQTRTRIETLCREAAIGCVDCKRELAASMTKMTEPFRERKAKWSEQDVTDILALGKRKAQRRARQTVQEVRRAIGLVMV